MSKSTLYQGQSFFNKVVELTGDVDNAFEMMLLNGQTSLTQKKEIGNNIKKSQITDYDVVDFYLDKKPATQLIIKNQQNYLLPDEFPLSF